MITRRQFLVITTVITANQFLSSCSNPTETLNVTMLQGSIPSQLVGAFRRNLASNIPIKFKLEGQLKKIFDLLKTWQQEEKPSSWGLNKLTNFWANNPAEADLVTLGNAWLENAIAQNLIQPLDISNLSSWQSLDPRFQKLVTRNDIVYAAPYRWGNTVIAYRKDKLLEFNRSESSKIEIKDWSDLWHPALTGRISLLDNYREVIGLTLKKLGHSYNSTNLGLIPKLESELKNLHQQVKFYSSTRYLQPLALGDSWAALGWSSDILPLVRRYPKEIGVVVPTSGTSLWADLWVQPKTTNTRDEEMKARLESWIEFCWQNSGASTMMLFTNGISPILNQENKTELTQDLKNNKDFVLSSLESFSRSEFIYPLDPRIDQAYKSLWRRIRT